MASAQTSTTIGTVRTVTPYVWTVAVTALARRLGITLSDDDMTWIAAQAGVVLLVLYRVGRELERRWPWVGRVLFGIPAQPLYTRDLPPPPPPHR